VKILVVTSIFPPDIGGPATYVPILTEGLINRGHQVHILTFGHDEDGHGTKENYQVDRIDRNQKASSRFLGMARGVIRAGRGKDLVFVNGRLLPEVMAVRAAHGLPVVAKVVGDAAWEKAVRTGRITHDFDAFQHTRYNPVIEGWRFLQNLCVRKAERIITPSNYLKQTLLSWGARKNRISVIPNAVSSFPFISEDRDKSSHAKPQNTFKILYAGRLAFHKRVDQIIQTLAQLTDTTLTILGDGEPKEGALKALAERLGVASRVRFHKPCSHNKMVQFFKSHHCLVLNSTYEGFPHVVLEAQLTGIPVLATATGGVKELIYHRETGFLIDIHEGVEGLTRAIRELSASNVLRRRLAEDARTRASEFTVDEMVKLTESTFLKTIECRRRIFQ
jgi:glycosyltransferase involved in cell wall biosynthesis